MLFHGKDGFAKAPLCYVIVHCLSCLRHDAASEGNWFQTIRRHVTSSSSRIQRSHSSRTYWYLKDKVTTSPQHVGIRSFTHAVLYSKTTASYIHHTKSSKLKSRKLMPVFEIAVHFSTVLGSRTILNTHIMTIKSHQPNTEEFTYLIEVKDKVRPRTCHEGPERERTYSSSLSLTSALDRRGWLPPRLT